MKKIFIILLGAVLLNSGCGTIFGGHIEECQKHKPATGSRDVRPAALIFDILFFPVISLTVDFVDGAMYVPCDRQAANEARDPMKK